MNPQKQFTGFLSSSADPGQLSLTMSSLTSAILSGVTLFAAVKGLDAVAITSQVQSVIDTVVTGVAAGMTVYHSVMTAYGLIRKLWYMWFAKPVVTVPANGAAV